MRLWIDCEFNDFRGELISMAIVSEDGREWYEVLQCKAPTEWVAKNVIPVLGKQFVEREYMQQSLAYFLSEFDRVHLIADWPEDIAHFCNLLITAPGYRLNTPPLIMEIRRDLDAISAIPHNALEDARAIRGKHMNKQAEPNNAE